MFLLLFFLNRVVRLYWVNVWTGAGLHGLGGAVVDQTLSVLISDRNSVDRHTLVLWTLPSSFHEAVQDDDEHDEDGHTQDGECSENTWGIQTFNHLKAQKKHLHKKDKENNWTDWVKMQVLLCIWVSSHQLPVLLSDSLRSKSAFLANTSFSEISKKQMLQQTDCRKFRKVCWKQAARWANPTPPQK